MDGLEVIKTQGNITIKHDSQYYDYVQNRVQLNEFLKDDKMREGNLKLNREQAQQAMIERYGFETKQEVPVEQRELSWKEKQKQKYQHKKLLKKTHEQYPMGTEHTLNIVSQHTEQVAARNAKIAGFRKPSDRLLEEEKKRWTLAIELDSYMDATIRATHPLPTVRIGEMIKKYDESFVNKLTPEYIRRHYTEVKQEMDKINCIAKNIQIGGIEPQIIQEVHGISRMTGLPYNFVEFANECRVLYNNVLMSHGLKVNEENDELVAVAQEDQAVIRSQYGSRLYRLKKLFSKNKDKQNIQDDILKYQDFLTKTEQEMERLHNSGEDTTQIESLLFKARNEINIIKAIRDNYDNPENLTEEQRQYANMHYAIKDEAYKEAKKTKIHLLRDIEADMKDAITDTENVKKNVKNEINALADRLYSDMSVEELEEHRRELYIVSTSILKGGITKYADTPLNRLKVSKIIFLANKLRAADILTGIRSDSITLDDLTEQERNSIINNTEGEITELDIAEYAKKMGVLAEKQYENILRDFYANDENEKLLEDMKQKGNDSEHIFTLKHKNASKIIDDWKEEIAKNGNANYTTLKAEYDKSKKELKKLQLDINGDHEYITKEKEKIKTKMLKLQIQYKMMCENVYMMYGGVKTEFRGAFRALSMFKYGPEGEMSDVEFMEFVEKLVSGTFEDDAEPEQKAQYIEDNKAALNILKKKSFDRNKYYYQKYGLRLVDEHYVLEHMEEISNDFKLNQNDTQMCITEGVMNMKEDKDILHYHLIMFYSIYASILKALPRLIAGYVKNPQEKYSTVKRDNKATMDKAAAEHYTYLKEHEGDILKL